MKPNLEEKRKEIFNLHQSWLRPDVPLMRQPSAPKSSNEVVQEADSPSSVKTNHATIIIVVIASILILLEILFFLYQTGLFK